MKINQQIIVKRWKPILEEYENIQNKVLSDNGPEFKGSLTREHPFETMCNQLGIKHIYTKPYRPQTNSKVEAF